MKFIFVNTNVFSPLFLLTFIKQKKISYYLSSTYLFFHIPLLCAVSKHWLSHTMSRNLINSNHSLLNWCVSVWILTGYFTSEYKYPSSLVLFVESKISLEICCLYSIVVISHIYFHLYFWTLFCFDLIWSILIYLFVWQLDFLSLKFRYYQYPNLIFLCSFDIIWQLLVK